MTKRGFVGLAVLAGVFCSSLGTSKAQAQHHRSSVVYPAYRSYYYPAPVVYTPPVYYSSPVVYSRPVVYSPAPVVYTYSRPAYYRPYYYGPSSFSFGYVGGRRNHHGGVSVRVGY